MKNKHIKNAADKMTLLAVIFVIASALGVLIVNILTDKIIKPEFEQNAYGILIIVINVCLVISLGFANLYLFARSAKIKSLDSLTPIEGSFEDVIVLTRRNQSEVRHFYHPLVKTAEGKYYMTFGKYNLSYYKVSYIKAGPTLIDTNIFRKDGSPVKVGDTVYLYIKKQITPTLKIIPEDRKVILKGDKYSFSHINEKYGIDIMNNIVYYEGAVEIENIMEEI